VRVGLFLANKKTSPNDQAPTYLSPLQSVGKGGDRCRQLGPFSASRSCSDRTCEQ